MLLSLMSSLKQIEDTSDFFKTTLKAGGVMDVVEQYPWSGVTVEHKRRDKRAGSHTGRVSHSNDGPQLQYVSACYTRSQRLSPSNHNLA